MEFLRFGSSIPGAYWGCCAVCIIQDFKQDPDAKYAVELVDGDGGAPIGSKFVGKTYREVFETRIRIGTFNASEMPNHAFLAVLTDWQLSGTIGSKWLKILKEHGFEFIRTVDNSVYTGSSLKGVADDDYDEEDGDDCGSHPNYIFGLFRNIGNGAISNPFQPPAAWTELEGGVEETFYRFASEDSVRVLQESRDEIHRQKWQKGTTKFYTRAELEAEGVPVWFAGRRSTNPQEPVKYREDRQKQEAGVSKPAPFTVGAAAAVASTPQPVAVCDDWL